MGQCHSTLRRVLQVSNCSVGTNPKQGEWEIQIDPGDAGILEVVSPVLTGGAVAASLISEVSQEWWLSGEFERTAITSSHVTVDGSCLVRGRSALGALNLIALWEALTPAMYPLFAIEAPEVRVGHLVYSPAMREAYAPLFETLMAGPSSLAAVEQAFADAEDLVELKGPAALAERGLTGFRNMAINLCKLLPIKCCKDCGRNRDKKTGAVEFRMFDLIFGKQFMEAILLSQHVMKIACRTGEQNVDLRPLLWESLNATSAATAPRLHVDAHSWGALLGLHS